MIFFLYYTIVVLPDETIVFQGMLTENNYCVLCIYTPKPNGADELFVLLRNLNDKYLPKFKMIPLTDMQAGRNWLDPTSELATFSGKEKEGVLRMLREHHKDARESNFELNKANPVSPTPTRKGTRTPNPTGARKRKLSKKASTGRNGPTTDSDTCVVCCLGGVLLICDGRQGKTSCANVCHLQCATPKLSIEPEGDWFCSKCSNVNVANKRSKKVRGERGERGANGKEGKAGGKGKEGKTGKTGQRGEPGERGTPGTSGTANCGQ